MLKVHPLPRLSQYGSLTLIVSLMFLYHLSKLKLQSPLDAGQFKQAFEGAQKINVELSGPAPPADDKEEEKAEEKPEEEKAEEKPEEEKAEEKPEEEKSEKSEKSAEPEKATDTDNKEEQTEEKKD